MADGVGLTLEQVRSGWQESRQLLDEAHARLVGLASAHQSAREAATRTELSADHRLFGVERG